MVSDSFKLQAAVIFFNFKEKFQERNDTNLLLEMWELFHDVGEACDVLMMCVDSSLKLTN